MTTNDSPTDNDGLRITRIRAKNYRSIRELDLELGPLTVLVGPNASGKSNVLDVLRFIRDVFNHGLDAAISWRDGIDTIRHLSRRGRSRDVELGFSATFENLAIEYSFVLGSDSNGGHHVKREYGNCKFNDDSKEFPFDVEEGRIIEPDPVLGLISLGFPTDNPSFFRFGGFLFNTNSNDPNSRATLLPSQLFRIGKGISNLGFHHVSPNVIRGPQKQLHSATLDEHGENLSSVLLSTQLNPQPPFGFDDLREALAHVVPGITDVRSEAVGGYLVLKLKHSNIVDGKGVWLDAAQESDGTLRMLALLTAIYQRQVPPLLGIEEPESAVHPGILTALAEILEEASLRQQVVITTHSPDFIDQFPIECIRSVEFVDGGTEVGEVSKRQVDAVKERLFTAGELHRMEGLEIRPPVAH